LPWYALLAIFIATLAILSVGGVAAYQLAYADRIYQGVTAAGGLDLSALTREEAAQALAEHNSDLLKRELRIRDREREWVVTAEELGLRVQTEGVLDYAYRIGRQGGVLQRLVEQLQIARAGRVIRVPDPVVDEWQLGQFVRERSAEINLPMVNAQLLIATDLQVSVRPSQVGRELATAEAIEALREALTSPAINTVELPVVETPPTVAGAHLEPVKTAVAMMLSAPLTLQFEDRAWTLSRQEIAELLIVRNDPLPLAPEERAKLDEEGLTTIASRLAGEIDQEPRKPRLQLEAGQLQVIREGQRGLELDTKATAELIKKRLVSDERTAPLPVQVTMPAGMGEDRLAIRELVSSATTNYGGGLAERRYNVELAASKLNGTVVGPGEVFSFNRELGPMTLEAGFKWGYGITRREGEVVTVPSVAGGICQVSTTLFQAAFWGGYGIEQRKGHTYWIDRYGQPPKGMKGLDATVDQVYDSNGKLIYTVDLKIKNTSRYPLLIEAKADGTRLTFNIYSTKPDWTVTVAPPQIEDVVKADTTIVREVDRSLAPGEQIWVEAAQDGFKSTIVRTVVERGKEPTVFNLVTTYRPSRNVVLAGPAGSN
jgi:vancomycin resistance protein YoaR